MTAALIQVQLLLLVGVLGPSVVSGVKLLGQFRTTHPAFVSVEENEHSQHALDRYNLLITTFSGLPFSTDHVYEVPAIGSKLASINSTHPLEVTHSITWPNEITQVPHSVFNKDFVVAAGGFLVPFKTHGSISLFDMTSTPPAGPYTITSGSDASWFYHRVVWKDMNGDGRLDAVTCRAKKPLFGSAQGEFVWFEHPATGALLHTWKMHLIAHGPDVYFDVIPLTTPDGSKFDTVVTSGFFSQSLNIYWSTDSMGRWNDVSKVKSRVIDNTFGAAFEVKGVDLNGDGDLELLVSGNSPSKAYLYSFEIPADFRTDKFPRHTLAGAFTPRQGGIGKGAPGAPLAVFPNSNSKTGKPLIVLSGDDDGRAYLITPSSNSASDWTYSTSTLLDVGSGTVGEIAVQDVDGDGFGEIFVPAYNKGLVYVYTFSK